jgi:hypothetical protein
VDLGRINAALAIPEKCLAEGETAKGELKASLVVETSVQVKKERRTSRNVFCLLLSVKIKFF